MNRILAVVSAISLVLDATAFALVEKKKKVECNFDPWGLLYVRRHFVKNWNQFNLANFAFWGQWNFFFAGASGSEEGLAKMKKLEFADGVQESVLALAVPNLRPSSGKKLSRKLSIEKLPYQRRKF